MSYKDAYVTDFSALNEGQKTVFLRALAHLAKSDGKFEKIEIEHIVKVADENGINADKIIKNIENDTEAAILKDIKKIQARRVAMELIKEMFLLAHTDENLSDEEIVFIGKCGLAMGIEMAKIEQISNWVIDRIVWLEQAKIIFED